MDPWNRKTQQLIRPTVYDSSAAYYTRSDGFSSKYNVRYAISSKKSVWFDVKYKPTDTKLVSFIFHLWRRLSLHRIPHVKQLLNAQAPGQTGVYKLITLQEAERMQTKKTNIFENDNYQREWDAYITRTGLPERFTID
jgi:hypothetical protein